MNATFILTAVPPNVRHALTRWMIEPAPGVFVGTMSSRVRNALWNLIKQETHGGWALLIHPDSNEQGYRIHSCGRDRRHVVDLDGIQLASMPAAHLEKSNSDGMSPGLS